MISALEFLVLAVAGYRGTQLVVHDSILDAPRSALYDWHSKKLDSKTRTALTTLIGCVYCAGFWVSGILLATWLLVTGQFDDAPLLTHLVLWVAVAGAAVLLNRIDDTLGQVAQ
jgi:hypothetical protein